MIVKDQAVIINSHFFFDFYSLLEELIGSTSIKTNISQILFHQYQYFDRLCLCHYCF